MKIEKDVYDRIILFLSEISKYENWNFSMTSTEWVGNGDPIIEANTLISKLQKKSNKLIDIL